MCSFPITCIKERKKMRKEKYLYTWYQSRWTRDYHHEWPPGKWQSTWRFYGGSFAPKDGLALHLLEAFWRSVSRKNPPLNWSWQDLDTRQMWEKIKSEDCLLRREKTESCSKRFWQPTNTMRCSTAAISSAWQGEQSLPNADSIQTGRISCIG